MNVTISFQRFFVQLSKIIITIIFITSLLSSHLSLCEIVQYAAFIPIITSKARPHCHVTKNGNIFCRNTFKLLSPSVSSLGHKRKLLGAAYNSIFTDDVGNVCVTDKTAITDEEGRTKIYDLSSPRNWLESLPVGAYTVLRCEYDMVRSTMNVSNTSTNFVDRSYNNRQQRLSEDEFHQSLDFRNNDDEWMKKWKIWGFQFHMKRLIESYNTFRTETQSIHNETKTQYDYNVTLHETMCIIRKILKHIVESDKNSLPPTIFMLTLLWYPNATCNKSNEILVKGHVVPFYSQYTQQLDENFKQQQQIIYQLNDVISVALVTPDQYYPNRKDWLPYSKISSWCTIRRPIEQSFQNILTMNHYKSSMQNVEKSNASSVSIHEYILTSSITSNDGSDEGNDNVVLLEGLTSNIFCIYPNNIIRTTMDHSLRGYAQTLIMEAAEHLGYTIHDNQSILLSDSSQWKEIFITSSIKIITPVQSVFIPKYYEKNTNNSNISHLQKIWSQSSLLENNETSSNSVCQQLYDFILRNRTLFITSLYDLKENSY